MPAVARRLLRSRELRQGPSCTAHACCSRTPARRRRPDRARAGKPARAGRNQHGQVRHRAGLRPRAAHGRELPRIRPQPAIYSGTIFHRVIANFIAQTGGYDEKNVEKPTRASIPNESGNGLSNRRGTVGLARTADPHSGNCAVLRQPGGQRGARSAAEPLGLHGVRPRRGRNERRRRHRRRRHGRGRAVRARRAAQADHRHPRSRK